jgi:hypothetical protein
VKRFERIDLEHFPTCETSKRMLARVSPIYERSYVGKWLFQVMGLEMKDARRLFDELRQQAFPETATWGLTYWEQRYGITPNPADDLEARRQAVLDRQNARSPMNPARIEAIINGMTGMPVTVTENVADYTFGVRIENTGDGSVDIPAVMVRLRKIKPSHQWFELDIGHSVIFENNPGAFIFSEFQARYAFSNARGGNLVFLDGSKQLDGSWKLNQTFYGVTFPLFTVASAFENEERLTARMTLDTWYELDGTVRLDGSRKLNAQITEEEI